MTIIWLFANFNKHYKIDRKDIYKFLKLLLYIQIKIIVFKNIDNYIVLILNKKY
jgi:hypothetical protein